MVLSVDWLNKWVLSTASITDIVDFKDDLRVFEASMPGIYYEPILTYKKLALGGGSFFHGVDFINGYQLKFPDAGNYSIIGNIGATIVPVAGVFVDRTKAAAFTTISGSGGSGPTVEEIRAELTPELDLIQLIPILL